MFKFHYFKQQPTKYINQKFKFYFPFGTWRCGIGVLIARREFSITWPPIITSKEIKTATDKQYLVAGLDRWTVREAHGEPDWTNHTYTLDDKWKVDEETRELYLPDGSKDFTLAQRLRMIYCSKDELEPCKCCLACRAADQIECLEELTDDLAGHLKTYMCHCGLSKCKCNYDYVMDSYRAVRGKW
jgi:hypothetical protein